MKKLSVLFVAAALVVAFTVPAMSADWAFYGSSRMKTFWTDLDEDAGDDAGLAWTLQGNSRIGANVKADAISGRFEYGTGVNVRILWGEWNFGAGSLGFGQHYTPTFAPVGNQAFGEDLSLLDMGGFYIGRKPMAQLKIKGFKLALVEPRGARLAGDKSGDVDITLPKLEASYDLKFDKFGLGFFGGYQTYSVEKSAEVADYDVDSYVVGVTGNFNFGPAYLQAAVHYGQNTGDYGAITVGADNAALVGNTVKDATTLGAAAAVGFKVSDMLSFEGGVGMIATESDVAGAQDDEAMVYYIQANISPAKGVYIVPEIGQYDYKDNTAGAPEGKQLYFGAKWQVNF